MFIVHYFIHIITDSGVPVKLLFQGEGHVVTVELKSGETYRGQLVEAEDTMNCQLKEGVPIFVSFLVSLVYLSFVYSLVGSCFDCARRQG